jgi:hypothetical protein
VRLELHPEARAELRSAALGYDEQRPGLGDEFIADVAATPSIELAGFPNPTRHGRTRGPQAR